VGIIGFEAEKSEAKAVVIPLLGKVVFRLAQHRGIDGVNVRVSVLPFAPFSAVRKIAVGLTVKVSTECGLPNFTCPYLFGA
jgi:hypothetical protein